MGVLFEKVGAAASTIRREAEYIAQQDSMDVFAEAEADLMAAMLLIADVLGRKATVRREWGEE